MGRKMDPTAPKKKVFMCCPLHRKNNNEKTLFKNASLRDSDPLLFLKRRKT